MRLRMALVAGFLGGALLVGVAFGAVQLLNSGGGSSPSTTSNNTASVTTSTSSNSGSQNVALAANCESAADIYQAVRPAVVEITSVLSTGRFGQQEEGTGSGVVINDKGDILTNNHVIDGAQSIEVKFSDGATAEASVVGTDPADDLAVVKVDPSAHKLDVAKLGDSSALRVGDPVLAIGNPFSLEGTLTQGIVSGLDRTHSTGQTTRPIRHMIQTDAAVNPGNSGGPLLNCTGEVIGINTLLENPTGQDVNVGVAFAVSVNTAKQTMSSMLSGQTVAHPWLGIAGTDITPAIAKSLGLSVQSGVYVTLVTDGSPAANAGLKPAFSSANSADNSNALQPGGDVITEADGHKVSTIDDLASFLDQNKKPGDTVTLTVIRDGKQMSVQAKLAEWPSGGQ